VVARMEFRDWEVGAFSEGDVWGEEKLPLPWRARRAASWRRAREGGMFRGGGRGAPGSSDVDGGSRGGEKIERAEREEGW
jgi:hypothetical protein